jgi:hypothetical protein
MWTTAYSTTCPAFGNSLSIYSCIHSDYFGFSTDSISNSSAAVQSTTVQSTKNYAVLSESVPKQAKLFSLLPLYFQFLRVDAFLFPFMAFVSCLFFLPFLLPQLRPQLRTQLRS